MKEKSKVHYVMMPVPVPMPIESDHDEDKSKPEVSVVGAFFWAIVLLFLLWFITGGYNALQ